MDKKCKKIAKSTILGQNSGGTSYFGGGGGGGGGALPPPPPRETPIIAVLKCFWKY